MLIKIQVPIFPIILLSVATFFTPRAAAQTVHALLVIMDADSSIGSAMAVDRQHVEKLLESVGRIYDVETPTLLSSRNEATSKNV